MILFRHQRCAIMGVLNVTPDSFSDGGRYHDLDAAIAHGRAMHEQGADLVDVGGESTRPGAELVNVEIELARVIPVIRELADAGIPVSVDTMRADVAVAALAAGAGMVNDVSGGLADPRMAWVIADHRVPWIVTHWRGHSKNMNSRANYHDVVAEVREELSVRVDAALAAGVAADALILDPGLGFAKRAEHNWALLQRLDVLFDMGFPVLVGASRKGFLGKLTSDIQVTIPPDKREDASLAVVTLAAAAGVWGVRVHEVARALAGVLVATNWVNGSLQPS